MSIPLCKCFILFWNPLKTSFYNIPLLQISPLTTFLCYLPLTQQLPTLALARCFVAENIELIDSSEFLEHFPQIIFIHGPGDLTHKHFNGVGVRFRLWYLAIHSSVKWKQKKALNKRSPIITNDIVHCTQSLTSVCIKHATVFIQIGILSNCVQFIKQKISWKFNMDKLEISISDASIFIHKVVLHPKFMILVQSITKYQKLNLLRS